MSNLNTGFVIVDFTAQWCPPCKALMPILESVAAERGLRLVAVDVDAEQATAARYSVRAMPTVVLLSDGVEVGRFLGLRSKAFISEAVAQALR